MRQPLCHNTYNPKPYYPFGMIMPGHSYCANSSYRFGFNKGSEKDDEVYGEGNSYTTEFRELDVRLGIWWGCDPKTSAEFSPYCAMNNNPILYQDFMGDDPVKREGLLKRIYRWVSGESYISRAKKYAAEHNIDDKNLSIYKDEGVAIIVEEKNESKGSFENGMVTITAHRNTKDVFRTLKTKKRGVFDIGEKYNDDIGEVFNNKRDVNGKPILNADDYPSGYFPGMTSIAPMDAIPAGKITKVSKLFGLAKKVFKGGKQLQRDKELVGLGKEFRRWFHQQYKEVGDPDRTRKEIKDIYDQWIRDGKPKSR